MTKRHSKGTRSLLEEMGSLDDFADTSAEIAGKGVRVISIVLDRIRPDPAQPRRVLPDPIRSDFIERRINARQALERWEEIVAQEAASLGRPRPDWPSMLEHNVEDRAYEISDIDPSPGRAGPEEDLLRSIVATAATILHSGQVSPITVYEMDSGSYYRIETGERRFWAHHWLNIWLPNGFDQIQCIVVENPSPWRQAAENSSREELSGIALARQAARLLLDVHGSAPNSAHPVPNDWYRLALQLRVPRGDGERLRTALGGIQRPQFSRLMALLRLPDEVWELADRYRLEERRLRYVLKVPDRAQQIQLVRAIIEKDLSADRVQHLVESGGLAAFLGGATRAKADEATELSERVANRWPVLARQMLQSDLSLVAEEWIRRHKPDEVREQVSTLRALLDMVENQLNDQ